jgi:hypothetical protein
MSAARQKILDEISGERNRQFNLPGSEFDQKHTINDWIAIAGQYLTRAADRKHIPYDYTDSRFDLVKSAAIIVAALEHLDRKTTANELARD